MVRVGKGLARNGKALARAGKGLARTGEGVAKAGEGLPRAGKGLAKTGDGLARAGEGLGINWLAATTRLDAAAQDACLLVLLLCFFCMVWLCVFFCNYVVTST